MSTFNASIDLGTIGSSLLNFSFSGCTGYDSSITGTTAEKLKNCAYLTGCTALTSYDNTPKSSLTSNSITLTGLTYDPSSSQMRWVHVKAVNLADGPATGDTKCGSSYLCQNIQITGIPSYTPTPAPTSQPTPTPTSTPIVTSTPTPTPTTGDPATNTPTPTPTNTNTPTPTPTETTPPPECITCSTGAFSSGTTDNGFVTHTYCLDLSSASNGATITLNYDAQYRLNRFDISDNIDGINGRTSGWVGADNTYTTAPYNTPGNANGSIVFTYNSSRTYELSVDIAPINPENPQNDNYQFTLICGGVITATPTPTATVTPTPTPYRIAVNDLWLGGPFPLLANSGNYDDEACNHTNYINSIYDGVDAWLYSATNICDAIKAETDSSLGFNWVLAEMDSDEYIWLSQSGLTVDSVYGTYVRLFQRSGTTQTLLPVGTCINCTQINEPTPEPTPIPLVTVNVYARQAIPYDAVTNNIIAVYQSSSDAVSTNVVNVGGDIIKNPTSTQALVISMSISSYDNLNLGAFRRVENLDCDYVSVTANVFAGNNTYDSNRFTNATGLTSVNGVSLQGDLYGVTFATGQNLDVYLTIDPPNESGNYSCSSGMGCNNNMITLPDGIDCLIGIE